MVNRKFKRYVEIAYGLKPSEIHGKTFHVTFIVRNGKIQSIGLNSFRQHPKILKFNYRGDEGEDIRGFVGIHSELDAVIRYGEEDCSNCTFINIRINKNGLLDNSKPCAGCTHVLKQVGFKRIYYTDKFGEFVELKKV